MSVSSLTSAAQGYATTSVSAANTAGAAAIAAIQNIGYTALSFDGVDLPAPPTVPDDLTPPELQEIIVEESAEPTVELLFQDISAIELGTAPTLSATAPTITLPSTPSQVAEFQALLPTIDTDIAFPDAPAELDAPLPTVPTVVDRDAPVRPTVTLPSFDALAPTDAPTAPTDLEGQFEDAYAGQAPNQIAMLDGYVDAMLAQYNPRYAEQMAAIEDRLATYIAGGTGFAPAVETAIYERSRTKQDAEARRVRDGAWADAAARGFTLPPGSLTSALRKTRQAAADNNAQAAREIVVLQAELEQKNLQFAVTLSANLRTTLLSSALAYHQNLITINGQALDYAKSVLGLVVESYNVAVRAFAVQLDAWKAEAAVYEAKVRAAMGLIELYRAEIQALEALTSVDRLRVDIYRARIDGLEAITRVYAAKIEATQGEASLERLKLDLFKVQVDAYGNLVQAKASEWQGFTAAVNGQRAKAEVFETQVRAFATQTQAYKTTIDAKSEVVRAQAITNQARTENFKAVWDSYRTVVQTRGDVARTKLDSQRQQVVAFQVQAHAQVANAQVRSDYYKAVSMVGIENARLSIEAIIKSSQNQQELGRAIAQVSTSMASVQGQLAGAAMAGMNTLAAEVLAE